MELAGPDGFEDGLVFVRIDDMLAKDAGDEVAADSNEFVVGIEVVECTVFGGVELGEDEVADVLGIGKPAGFIVAIVERAGHGSKCDTAAIGGGGEVRAEAGHAGVRRTDTSVGSGTLVADTFPARRVVVSGVVSAEAFDETSLAGVAILPQPRVPARAGLVCGFEELLIVV